MAFIPIPNSMTLCFNFATGSGSEWQFCLTIRKSAGAPTSTDLSNVAAIGSAWWTSDLKALTCGGTLLNEIVVTDQTVQGGAQFVDTIAELGTLVSTDIPASAAMVVSLATAKRGRSYRGRAYVSGKGISQILNANLWQAAHVTAMVGAFNSLQNDLDLAGYDIVVPSKRHNNVVTNPAETNEVIAITIDNRVDSQRRRLVGRGT